MKAYKNFPLTHGSTHKDLTGEQVIFVPVLSTLHESSPRLAEFFKAQL